MKMRNYPTVNILLDFDLCTLPYGTQLSFTEDIKRVIKLSSGPKPFLTSIDTSVKDEKGNELATSISGYNDKGIKFTYLLTYKGMEAARNTIPPTHRIIFSDQPMSLVLQSFNGHEGLEEKLEKHLNLPTVISSRYMFVGKKFCIQNFSKSCYEGENPMGVFELKRILEKF
jgi:hypothetical protein